MTQSKSRDEWQQLPWKKFRRVVARLQHRIYKAQKAKDIKKVKRLQRLLLSSKAAKYLAVRQVTQLNTGKKTAGVDGKTALTPKERLDLVQRLEGWKVVRIANSVESGYPSQTEKSADWEYPPLQIEPIKVW